jgi:hypothetical protein
MRAHTITTTKLALLLSLLAIGALGLVACGGGDDDQTTAASETETTRDELAADHKSCGSFGRYRFAVVEGDISCRVARRVMDGLVNQRLPGAWICSGPDSPVECFNEAGGTIRAHIPKNKDKVEIAERFMEARNAYDAEKAMSLLADDGATALLMDNNRMFRGMPTLRLDREELALALEAERLLEVRYESFECQPDPVRWAKTQIMCSYLMDDKLMQIDGSSPVERSFGIGVRNGRVTNLSFPFLNVGFPAEVPADRARFVNWVDAEHPQAGGPFDRGKLFRTLGQEVTLKLTRESIDLLARYLEEYERSVSG